jgi:hypothetical protein
MKPVAYGWILLSLIVAMSGCSLQSTPSATPASRPVVTLSSPAPGEPLELGQEISIQSTSVDSTGIARVELLVNGETVWVDANAQPQPNTPFIVAQPWQPQTPGRYIIQARAYNMDNAFGESLPLAVEVGSAVAEVIPAAPTATATAPGRIATATRRRPANTPQAPTPEESEETPVEEPTETPTEEPEGTPTPSPTPTPTPPPQEFEPTGLEPEGRFLDIWFELGGGDSRLGYPTEPEIADREYAQQYFEKGLMFWWDNPQNPDIIWVIDSPNADWQSGATSNRYSDTWKSADGEINCEEARETGPVRGFGKLWCERPELQTRLGRPREPERGSGGVPPYAQVQFFQGGVILHNPANAEVYVLFDQGDWQRFEY